MKVITVLLLLICTSNGGPAAYAACEAACVTAFVTCLGGLSATLIGMSACIPALTACTNLCLPLLALPTP